MSENIAIGIGAQIGLLSAPIQLVNGKSISQFSVKKLSGIAIHNPTPAHIAVYEDKGTVSAIKRNLIVYEGNLAVQPSNPLLMCPPFSFVCMPVVGSLSRLIVFEGDYVADLTAHSTEAQVILYDEGENFQPTEISYRAHSRLTLARDFAVPISSTFGRSLLAPFSLSYKAKNTLWCSVISAVGSPLATAAITAARVVLNANEGYRNLTRAVGIIPNAIVPFLASPGTGQYGFDLSSVAGLEDFYLEVVSTVTAGLFLNAWIDSEF